MIHYLISAFVLGFIVAIPPGAVTFVAAQYSLKYGIRYALIFTAGTCLSDIFYLTIVYIGMAKLLVNNTELKIGVFFFSGILLIYIGFRAIKFSGIHIGSPEIRPKKVKSIAVFLSGIGVTLLNPPTIVGWLAVASNFFLLWQDRFPLTIMNGFFSISIIMCGVMCWFVPLIYIISRMKKLFDYNIIKGIITTSGVLLVFLGISAWYQMIKNILLLG